jgi:hypothetical protein
MAWVTTKEVKTLVKSSLTSSDLTSIIDLAQEEIEAKAGTTYHVYLKFAILYLSAANALRALKTSGELAYTNKIGVTHQINEIDGMIERYDVKSEDYLKKFQTVGLRQNPNASIALVPCNYYEAE